MCACPARISENERKRCRCDGDVKEASHISSLEKCENYALWKIRSNDISLLWKGRAAGKNKKQKMKKKICYGCREILL